MGKQYKIKRSRKYGGGTSFRAKPHPLMVVFGILALAALVALGIFLYQPIAQLLAAGPAPDRDEGDLPSASSTAEPPSETSSTSTTEPSAQEQEPAQTVASELRVAYMPVETAINPTARDAFIAGLNTDVVNAVMVDIKNYMGTVLFQTTNEQAKTWGAVSATPFDLTALAQALESKGFSLAVRMSAFRDPIAAAANRENAIMYKGPDMSQSSDTLWLDNTANAGGRPWLNPYAPGAQAYLTALASEAVDAGAEFVVLDYYHFPNYSELNAGFGDAAIGVSRAEILKTTLQTLTETLEQKGARTAISVTTLALTQDAFNIARYGGSPLDIAGKDVVLGVQPYQFGGSYNAAGLVVSQPVQNPGGAVETMLRYAQSLGGNHHFIPLVQGGNEPSYNAATPYTSIQVDAQLDAVSNAGLAEYILHSSTGEYLFPEPSTTQDEQ